MICLKNAEWINEVKPGTYTNVMKNINESLINYVIKLKDMIAVMEIDIENKENL